MWDWGLAFSLGVNQADSRKRSLGLMTHRLGLGLVTYRSGLGRMTCRFGLENPNPKPKERRHRFLTNYRVASGIYHCRQRPSSELYRCTNCQNAFHCKYPLYFIEPFITSAGDCVGFLPKVERNCVPWSKYSASSNAVVQNFETRLGEFLVR